MGKKITFNEFVDRSNEIHNSKYAYHEDSYTNTRNKTRITCPIHGDFYQTPKNHMNGQGCPQCGKEVARIYHKHNYEPFIRAAKERFGDDFSFPNIERQYVNNKTYITVRCNKCGYEFSRRPNDLLSDKFNECKNCKHIEKLENRNKLKIKKTNKRHSVGKEEYIKRFREKFGDSITPFMDEYKNTQSEIHFKCNQCGYIFKRRPHNCLDSDGCPKCKRVNNQKYTNDIFIEKAREIHGDKYDYSKVNYVNSDTKVCVICHEKDKFGDEHGEFYVTPHSHIGSMRSGCPKCSGKFRKDTEYFIKEAKLVHGDKYIYDETEYVSALKNIKVICPTHGPFSIKPNDHLNGKGCKKCGYETVSDKLSISFDEFIERATVIHNNKYDYSKVDLKNRGENGRICIICPIHGEFWQSLGGHLRGNGCPKCKQSHLENEIMRFLDEKSIKYEPQKRFRWLGGRKSVDFFLPDYNIAIECQGIQHFEDTFFGKAEEKMKNDLLKREICEKNGIKVLYYSNLGIEYPYSVFEDKDLLLQEVFKSDLIKICEDG